MEIGIGDILGILRSPSGPAATAEGLVLVDDDIERIPPTAPRRHVGRALPVCARRDRRPNNVLVPRAGHGLEGVVQHLAERRRDISPELTAGEAAGAGEGLEV